MSPPWNRRRFLTTAAAAVPGLAVLPRALRAQAGPDGAARSYGETGGKHASGTDAPVAQLPPRVVGLRTDGGNFRFDPDGLVIAAGEKVIWLNMGDFHSVTAFHPDNGKLIGGKLPLRIPRGAEPWHSGMLGLTDGTQFEHTFTLEGVYDYFCQPHYLFGMVARIVVGAPHDGPGTKPLEGVPDRVKARMPALATVVGAARRANEWASRFNGVLYLIANGQDGAAPARHLAGALAADERLKRRLGGATRSAAVSAATSAFVEAVASGTDYEALVGLADAAKAALAAPGSQEQG